MLRPANVPVAPVSCITFGASGSYDRICPELQERLAADEYYVPEGWDLLWRNRRPCSVEEARAEARGFLDDGDFPCDLLLIPGVWYWTPSAQWLPEGGWTAFYRPRAGAL